MENKKNVELHKQKASIKSKLVAAIAMLLVSTIMMSSTTYAWFVLSTAPEVKGMSTTVGSNGALEIALLNDSSDTSAIESGVGKSSANGDVASSNITWGNIVDLSDATYYGLNQVTLYPSALNMASATHLTDLFAILKTPTYGTDGRVASLEANTQSARYKNSTFAASAGDLGVRAIGTYTEANPVLSALDNAKRGYSNALIAANTQALTADNAQGLTKLLVAKALEQAAPSMAMTITDISAIQSTLTRLQLVTQGIETALQNAIAAKYIATNKTTIEVSSIKLADYAGDADFGAAITEVNELKQDITDALAAYNTVVADHTGAYTWDEYKDLMDTLMDVDSLTINEKTFDDISALTDAGKQSFASNLMNDAEIDVFGGIMAQTADMVNTYVSPKFTLVITEDDPATTDNELQQMKDATMTVNPVKESGEVTLTKLQATVNGFTIDDITGDASNIINTAYGYIVDLAFRSSADTTLSLTGATQRVGTDTATQGGGSTFTVTSGNVSDLSALRIVFINTTTYEVLGVATVDGSTTVEGSTDTYALHMQNYTIDPITGAIAVTGNKQTASGEGEDITYTADDSIIDLVADQAVCISALVYLDGNYVSYAQDAVAGTLNLQFSSSTSLTPMAYSNWVVDDGE